MGLADKKQQEKRERGAREQEKRTSGASHLGPWKLCGNGRPLYHSPSALSQVAFWKGKGLLHLMCPGHSLSHREMSSGQVRKVARAEEDT